MRLPTKVLRIGRASDNDVVVADLSVSRYHAELRKTGRGYEIVDLASHNGTFVNGQWVTAAPVTERDIISIGPATFRLVGDELQEFIDTGDISLAARDLTVRLSSGKVLLDHVSFPLGERCLLGVIGPSGAGKSTLLGALTGSRPGDRGQRPVRQSRPVHVLRRAAAPDRAGTSGQHPAYPADRAARPGLRG